MEAVQRTALGSDTFVFLQCKTQIDNGSQVWSIMGCSDLALRHVCIYTLAYAPACTLTDAHVHVCVYH